MQSFDDLLYFEAVVRNSGFGAASRATGIAKSKLSRRVKQLEDRLGARLIERTTHRFTVTEIGRVFYRHCQNALAEVEAAEEAALFLNSEPRGLVRVGCPPGLPAKAISDSLPRFFACYPKVQVQLVVARRRLDLIEERIDVAVRVRSQFDTDAELTVKQLATIRTGLVAHPKLLEEHGAPRAPDELARFPTIGVGERPEDESWDLVGPDDRRMNFRHLPRLSSNDFTVIVDGAVAGLGVALAPEILTRPFLESGELVRVLPDWHAREGILHIVFTSRRGMLPSVRAFVDFTAETLRTSINEVNGRG